MKRARGAGFGAVVEAGLALVPEAVRPLVECDWFLGADPVLADLHHYGGTYRYTDGTGQEFEYTYQSNPHTVYDHHQLHLPRARRRVTVVMTKVWRPAVVVHELGHVLHQRLGWWGYYDRIRRTTDYAHKSEHEAFAEAWTSWCVPGYGDRPDEATVALFERLAAGELT